MQKLLWEDQWRQDLDFIDPRVAQLRWLAIKRGFIQRLPRTILAAKLSIPNTLHRFSADVFCTSPDIPADPR